MSIREFVNNYHSKWLQEHPLEERMPDPIDWHRLLQEQNYVQLRIPESLLVGLPYFKVDAWCIKTFGTNHYVHVGNYIWLEDDHQATVFALRWL